MRKNKGISLISLVVMIVVMIILAAIALKVVPDSYENALETKAEAERQQVITAVTGRFADNQRNSTANPIVGLMILDEYLDTEDDVEEYIIDKLKKDYSKFVTGDVEKTATQKDLIKRFVKDNFDDMEYTRILEHTDLIELGLGNINLNSVYIVNYYSSDVVGPIN